MYSFRSTVFCCSLNVHPDVRDIIAVGKTLECFRLATLKLKERCLVLKTFFFIKAVLISQSIKQFTEQLYIIILLLNKCSFVTNSYKAIKISSFISINLAHCFFLRQMQRSIKRIQTCSHQSYLFLTGFVNRMSDLSRCCV